MNEKQAPIPNPIYKNQLTQTLITLRPTSLTLHFASKGTFFGILAPFPSLKSTNLSSTLSQSKHCIKLPKAKPTTRWASPLPGHALRPIPNASMFGAPIPPPSNRSGLNVSGSSQTDGSRWMAHALTITIAPRGTSYPAILQSDDASWGTSNGAAGNNRNVSDIMFRR